MPQLISFNKLLNSSIFFICVYLRLSAVHNLKARIYTRNFHDLTLAIKDENLSSQLPITVRLTLTEANYQLPITNYPFSRQLYLKGIAPKGISRIENLSQPGASKCHHSVASGINPYFFIVSSSN